MAHVFVSYVREDQAEVDRLCSMLRVAGIEVWVDRQMISPGQRWQGAIRAAVEAGSFFLACFSKSYRDRDRTYMNEELLLAVEELRKRPRDRAWFIPVLLSDGTVPDLPIGAGETLRDIQWVDLHSDWSGGVHKLIQVLTVTGRQQDKSTWITLMVTDLLASAISERLQATGDQSKVLSEVASIQQAAVRENNGAELVSPGDSLMASFDTADAAVRCALLIQTRVTQYRETHTLPMLQLRIAVHAGQGVVSEGRIYGEAVHVAARICSRAEPGCVLISDAVAENLDKHQFRLESRKTAMLQGKATPINLFIVRAPV